ncbi:MAG: CpXC domain-containing protein [Ignavibacteria bacterium]
MTKLNITFVNCLECDYQNNVELYESVNVTIDPDLKEKILDDSFKKFVCENCKFESKLEYGFMYHDMEKQIMIVYNPDKEYLKEVIEQIKNDSDNFPAGMKSPGYFSDPVAISDWEELKVAILKNDQS